MSRQRFRRDEREPTRAKPIETERGPIEASGARIDDYWIVRKLGEGGMGVVYEAEQQHPRRPVALKVLRASPEMGAGHIALFRREAQALARLRHRGIASVYATGSTADDQHFFAMELVRGVALGEYLGDSRNKEDFSRGERRKRLRLFLEICDAVNYAHQRGVIHRDLKPTNVIVVNEPGALQYGILTTNVPEIKVLDFGLARVTSPEGIRWSEARGVQGTLTYMSPEQAGGRPDEIDLRTDVYSLGVMLYEMMTGALPYCICPGRPLEAVRTIREEPPEPPRRLLREQGLPPIDRDLETILLRAIEKEPEKRYQSVLSLAEDIERYLANQPILARPPTTMYQLRKLILRHRASFGFVAGLFLLSGVSAVTMATQRKRALTAEQQAEAEAAKARAVTEILVGVLSSSDPDRAGRGAILIDILERTSKSAEGRFVSEPALEGAVEAMLSESYRGFGLYDRARQHAERSLAVRKRGLGETHPDTIGSTGLLAVTLCFQGREAEADRLFQRALFASYASLPLEPWRRRVLQGQRGACLTELGRYERAEPLLLESYSVLDSLLGRRHRETQRAVARLIALYERWGRGDDVERYRLLTTAP